MACDLDKIMAGMGKWLGTVPPGVAQAAMLQSLSNGGIAAGEPESPEEPLEEWDYSDCEVLDLNEGDGGGDTFDCYPEGEYVGDDGTFAAPEQEGFEPVTLSGGTGIGEWVGGNSPFGYVHGDTFDGYDEEDPVTQTLDQGVGIGAWVGGDGPE